MEVLLRYSLINSTDKLHLDYNNVDYKNMKKVFMTNDEFNITRNNFTYVNDQLYTFIKTLDPAKESFFPIKNVLITLEIKLN